MQGSLFNKFALKLRSSRQELLSKKEVLRNSAKFTGNHLRQSLILNKVAGLSLPVLLPKVAKYSLNNLPVFALLSNGSNWADNTQL